MDADTGASTGAGRGAEVFRGAVGAGLCGVVKEGVGDTEDGGEVELVTDAAGNATGVSPLLSSCGRTSGVSP